MATVGRLDLREYFNHATLQELEEILRRAEAAELGNQYTPRTNGISAADLVSFKGSWRDLIVFLEHLIRQRRADGVM